MVDCKDEVLHAVLERVELSMFRATYRGDFNPATQAAGIGSNGPRILPDMHSGTDAAAVRMWVEQLAASRGYTKLVWDELPPDVIAGAC